MAAVDRLPMDIRIRNSFSHNTRFDDVPGDIVSFFMVRNPWQWYVSSYEFAQQFPDKSPGHVGQPFCDFLDMALNKKVQRFVSLPVGQQSNYFLNYSYPRRTLRVLRKGWKVLQRGGVKLLDPAMLPPSKVRAFRLEDGLEAVVKFVAMEFGQELHLPKEWVHQTTKRELAYYYSADLLEKVATKESLLIRKFGYTPPPLGS